MGFGPKCAVAGDQEFLLIGSHVPFILRPADEKFELVGACYVHGVMYGEGLHEDLGFDNQLYPGSTPGGDWNFSQFKAPHATWMRVQENDDCLHDGGSIYEGLTIAELDDAVKPLKKGGQRFLLCEGERDSLLIETEYITLK